MSVPPRAARLGGRSKSRGLSRPSTVVTTLPTTRRSGSLPEAPAGNWAGAKRRKRVTSGAMRRSPLIASTRASSRSCLPAETKGEVKVIAELVGVLGD